MGPTESIRDLAEPVVAAFGLELWDVEVGGGIVRVLVDRPVDPDGGRLDVEVLADASHALSAALDDRDDLAPAGRYTLEVSSPGIERTLRTPAQYERYLGADVAIKLSTPVGGTRRLRGTLAGSSADGVRVLPDGGDGTEIDLTYDQIERARTVLVWGPAPKPGSQGAKDRPRAGGKGGRAPTPAPASRNAPLSGSATNPKDAQ